MKVLGNKIGLSSGNKESTLTKNFGLTLDEFNHLSSLLKTDNNALLHHIFSRYSNHGINLLKRKYGVSRNEAYDLFTEALLDFRAKILKDKIRYGNLKSLFTRMACNVFINKKRYEKNQSRAVQVFLESTDVSMNLSEEILISTLQECLKRINETDALLLKKLFLDEEPPEDLASAMNISYASLRKRKQRAIKRLKEQFIKKIHEL